MNAMTMKAKRKVLLIYTGGTIGMVQDHVTGRLVPFDFDALRSQIPELMSLSAEVSTLSFDHPIDSSDIGLEHWRQMAELVEVNYNDYDGFVILHGTDTMAYSASALSFMFVNLAKPVILTGSQLPIGMVRTDGKENIITAIEIAADYRNGLPVVPEVAIYFEYMLYRGNRTFKYNAEHFEAFRSPDYPALAEAGINIHYRTEYIRDPSVGEFRVESDMDNRVAVLTLFPGVSRHIVEAALNIRDNRVLIIRTFGSGNAITAEWFLNALKEAIRRGLIIVNVSQCRAGSVEQSRYSTGAALEEMGVVAGDDIQFEAAVCKSMHLLSKISGRDEFERLFSTDLRGELTKRDRE